MAITAQQLRNKFNLHYDNIMSGVAPGINDYELSLYLTTAHRNIILDYYQGTVKGDSVDINEKTKSILSMYTISTKVSDTNLTEESELDNGFYRTHVSIPIDVWFILKENVVFIDTTTSVWVKPIQHDDFWLYIDNPFKQPNKFRAWRLDEAYGDGEKRNVDILSYKGIESYSLTYIQKQQPIVLSNLGNIVSGLAIEGETMTNIPSVVANNEWLADLIVNRAVELATRDYKQNTIENQVALNQRME